MEAIKKGSEKMTRTVPLILTGMNIGLSYTSSVSSTLVSFTLSKVFNFEEILAI